MRILFVGDVVGRAGRTAVSELLPGMIRDWSLDLVVVNGENSAGEFSEGNAGPRVGADRSQERRARAHRKRHRPRVHDAVR